MDLSHRISNVYNSTSISDKLYDRLEEKFALPCYTTANTENNYDKCNNDVMRWIRVNLCTVSRNKCNATIYYNLRFALCASFTPAIAQVRNALFSIYKTARISNSKKEKQQYSVRIRKFSITCVYVDKIWRCNH